MACQSWIIFFLYTLYIPIQDCRPFPLQPYRTETYRISLFSTQKKILRYVTIRLKWNRPLCLTSTFYFSAYSEQLKQYRDHCDVILNEITEALRYLQDLHKQHLFVSTKTGALHEACEQLLQDQVRYMNAM